MNEIIETPINGVKISLNKVIGDVRGHLCEIAPGGTKNSFVGGNIGNVYCATATQKGVARGAHYHHKLIENFYTLTGSALWLLKDFRKDSKTFGETYAVVFGDKKVVGINADQYVSPENMAQLLVPNGVYHVFYPLTDKEVIVLALTNLPHDNDDYIRLEPENDKDLKGLVKKYIF
jgi:dTDP-4-dehydrorhamnose 3,5-epimerase-like enzyme